ncbi:MAG: DUF2750 domain-containing protein [Porticoccaceae bacterium]|jgi:hypothetical protein|nr:DUF2750 domain-containing protein [Porticoccaceae bacterium]MDA8898698.1 DUF2750 domain-containing protein [Porticoccaceae bacterium]
MQPLSEDLQENLDRFIVESLERGCVWGLCDSEGNWAMVPSDEDADVGVIPFWSDKPLAEQLCVDEWSVYEPVAIAMEEFLDDWLMGMHEDVHRAGVNWNEDLEGQELEPLDLLEEFESELD